MNTISIKFLLSLIIISLCVGACETDKDTSVLDQKNTEKLQAYIGEVLVSNSKQDYYKLFEKEFTFSKYTLLDKREITKILKSKKYNDNLLVREIDQRSTVYGLLFTDAKTPDLGDKSKDTYDILYLKTGKGGSNLFRGGAFLVVDDFGYPCPDLVQCERCVGCNGPYKTCFYVCMSESGDNCSSC